MPNIYAYMRISTKEERNIQKYNRQENSIKTFLKNNKLDLLLFFKEDCSGKNFDREKWCKLEKIVNKGDVIIFKDISRFTREAENGYKKYIELMEKGIDLIFIDNPTISTTYIKNLMNTSNKFDLVAKTAMQGIIKLLLIVELDRVQKEREILISRIKQGLKASTKKSGRKKGSLSKLTEEMEKDIIEYLNDRTITQQSLVKKFNVSRNTLKKYINYVKEKK